MGFGHRNITIFVMVGVFGFLLGSFGINSVNTDNSLQTDSVFAVGHLQLILKDADGNIKQYQQTDNLIVAEGYTTMADLLFPTIDLNNNSTDSKFSFIGIGTGTSGEASDDDGLEFQVDACRLIDATIFGSPSPGSVLVFLNATFFGNDCNGTFQEAVLANSEDGGEILSRQAFTGITLGNFDELDVFWDIQLGT